MNKKLIVSSILAIAFLSTTVAPAVGSATDHQVNKQVIKKQLIKDDELKPKTLKKLKEKPRALKKVLKKVKKKT